jgi:hypothetical protein
MLVACRRGRTLHVHAPSPDSEGRVPWIAIASEHPGKVPAGGRAHGGAIGEKSPPWRSVDEDSWLGVDGSLRLHRGWL